MGLTKQLMLEEMELEQQLQEVEDSGQTRRAAKVRRKIEALEIEQERWQQRLREVVKATDDQAPARSRA